MQPDAMSQGRKSSDGGTSKAMEVESVRDAVLQSLRGLVVTQMQTMGNSLTKAIETRMAAMESRLNDFDVRLSRIEVAGSDRNKPHVQEREEQECAQESKLEMGLELEIDWKLE